MSESIYTVSTLNAESAELLSKHFGFIYVTGEISNLSRPSSGHLYFSLKDDRAQIRCALFRFQHQKIDFALENGQEIIVQAQVSLYEPRGDYQLIVSTIQLAGAGKLQIAYERLKKELENAGLFDEKHKKPLPLFPKKIGIITSPTAAALQDILKVLKKRFASIPIIVYSTQVQGNVAATQIVAAIQRANQHHACDVLILARGGGSIEDLYSFNEKSVAVAIFESAIPIVTGIGHQTDFTIADFVADVRAPTPSAAAEIASPDRDELLIQLSHYQQRLFHLIRTYLQLQHNHLVQLQKRLQHPKEKIKTQAQQLDQLENNLHRAMKLIFAAYREKLAHAAYALETLSPLSILQRGFSITYSAKNQVVKRCSDVVSGDCIVTRLIDGEIESVVV